MNSRIEFLKEQTLSGANKCCRTPLPTEFSVVNIPCSLAERKAHSLKLLLESMPVYIGEKELIVGTRTYLKPHEGNKDGHDIHLYDLNACIPYANQKDIGDFRKDESHKDKKHYTPDFSIILNNGIDGIIADINQKRKDSLTKDQLEFLTSVEICYQGVTTLIERYAKEALRQANLEKDDTRYEELISIYNVCKNIAHNKPSNFHEAVQLLLFSHLVTIVENFEFVCYGRLDYILQPFYKDISKEKATELIECMLLKMYDLTDIVTTYLYKYAGQLVMTLGGLKENGENAVEDVSMIFLDAIEVTNLSDPIFNVRVSSKNPPAFKEKLYSLTVKGYNMLAYYNDDIWVENLINAGINPSDAYNYSFDLCQDILIPGKSDTYLTDGCPMIRVLLDLLEKERNFETFDDLLEQYNYKVREHIRLSIEKYNFEHSKFLEYRTIGREKYINKYKNDEMITSWHRHNLINPLPYISSLYHGTIETATDLTLEGYPITNGALFLSVATEAINSLAAIKKVVFEQKMYTLDEVYNACLNNFEGENQESMRKILWAAPKWGNDDDYVDLIGKNILENGLNYIKTFKTITGVRFLTGIHQSNPVATGRNLMATPEGRKKGLAVSVTLTPESGTMINGATAALKSASKIDNSLVEWNFCIMVNYFKSVFKGNNGNEIFKNLIEGYFNDGGLQHQPNILDVEELKDAQLHPEKYKNLVVRLWGVCANFIDLAKESQDELISRFS